MNDLLNNLMNCVFAIVCFNSIYWVHKYFLNLEESVIIIAAFGAAAVLAFSRESSKFSLLEMLTTGMFTAFMGVFFESLELAFYYQISFTIGMCILVLNSILATYPPAGAIAIIPLISNTEIQDLGYLFIICPTMTGLILIYSFSKLKEKINVLYHDKKRSN